MCSFVFFHFEKHCECFNRFLKFFLFLFFKFNYLKDIFKDPLGFLSGEYTVGRKIQKGRRLGQYSR